MNKSRLLLALAAGALVVVIAGCGGSNDAVAPLSSLDNAPPAAPTGLGTVLMAGNHTRALSWAPNAEADLGSYQVYQYAPSPTSNDSYVLVATVAAAANTWPLPDVDATVTTWFKLRAVDQAGNRSAESAPRAVMLLSNDPGPEPVGTNEPPKRH